MLKNEKLDTLFKLIADGNFEKFKNYADSLDLGRYINLANTEGHGLLHQAILKNKVKILKYLLEKGANPNNNLVSLICLSIRRKTTFNITKHLVEYGANVNEQCGRTLSYPLCNVIFYNSSNIKTIKLLLDNGARNTQNYYGVTPFKMAIAMNNKEILNLFLKHYSYNELVGD